VLILNATKSQISDLIDALKLKVVPSHLSGNKEFLSRECLVIFHILPTFSKDFQSFLLFADYGIQESNVFANMNSFNDETGKNHMIF